MVEPDWVFGTTSTELVLLHRMGACRGHDPRIFYPELGESARRAKFICRGCPVRITCREYALENYEQIGVWGGMTVRERKRERARRMEAGDELALPA